MTCQQTCDSMIAYIEAVKQRNTNGDIYLDKRICTMIVFMQERNVAFAFIVSMPNSNSDK